ncbi:MAG: alanine--tRNA ligase, partial [Abditibacteriales bacterium]|nr:alanine--tRNA ligase [Abditibacteriales bacterium]MDW8366987.1 alanine--tRNA ligase [Abditibacteriales bacterium]
MSGHTIREKFLKFFESKNHKVMPSASLNPATYGDFTTNLTSAGMQPLVPFFKGEQTPPHPRLASCQKCCRADDIEEVGKTWRHCTFFEMLGNFSFGDYFKRESIAWGWEFVTEVLNIPKKLLWVTVHVSDDEAAEIWKQFVSADRILRFDKDNWWGLAVGPCGPCSEIFVDRGLDKGCGQPDCAPNCPHEKTLGCDRWGEIWNHVFQQFNKSPDGTLTPLPRPGIDTGAGLERIAAFLQGSGTIFESDLLQPICDYVLQIAGEESEMRGKEGQKERFSRSGLLTAPTTQPPNRPTTLAVRVIADHIRAATFLLGDESPVIPSNDGAGYMVRRFIRRAFYYGWTGLNLREPFLHKIVPVVVRIFREPYPELARQQEGIIQWVRNEEERFGQTLERGMTLLEELIEQHAQKNETVLDGRQVFRLYETYGFPKELTVEIARERQMTIDEDGYQRAEAEHAAGGGKVVVGLGAVVEADLATLRSEFLGYQTTSAQGSIIGAKRAENDWLIVLDQTPFYAEAGGQVGDIGTLRGAGFCANVKDTQRHGDAIVHVCEVVEGTPQVGLTVTADVDAIRRAAIRRAHSATHLLHKALRTVLGEHATQQGSLVRDDYLRFDFSHFAAVTSEQLRAIERIVNDAVLEAMPVRITFTTLDKAKKKGAMALFEGKYGDKVRMVTMGKGRQPFSIELCGGTHLSNTAEVGLFKIINESSVGANLRRIEALTGKAAYDWTRQREALLARVAAAADTHIERLPEQVERLRRTVRELERKLESLQAKAAASQADALLAQAHEVNGLRVIAAKIDNLAPEALGTLADQIAAKSDA